jgi:hypothetical protein
MFAMQVLHKVRTTNAALPAPAAIPFAASRREIGGDPAVAGKDNIQEIAVLNNVFFGMGEIVGMVSVVVKRRGGNVRHRQMERAPVVVLEPYGAALGRGLEWV